MRVAGLALALAAVLCTAVGCASTKEERWRRVDGSALNPEQLRDDQLDCMNRIGAPAPQSSNPMSATRNQMIDCMRMKGWTKS